MELISWVLTAEEAAVPKLACYAAMATSRLPCQNVENSTCIRRSPIASSHDSSKPIAVDSNSYRRQLFTSSRRLKCVVGRVSQEA
jgi:hypothetical protein